LPDFERTWLVDIPAYALLLNRPALLPAKKVSLNISMGNKWTNQSASDTGISALFLQTI